MPTTGFFGLVWRFNAIVIALAAIGVVAASVLLAGSILIFPIGDHPTNTNLVPRADDAQQPRLILGPGTPIDETPFVVFQLMRGFGRGDSFSGGYDGGQIKNLLFVDGATAKGQWMFEGTNHTIEMFDSRLGWAPRLNSSGFVAKANLQSIWIGVRLDGAGPAKQPASLVVFSFADRSLHTIVTGIDAIKSVSLIDRDKMLAVYEVGEKTIAATISVNDYTIVASNELPRVK